MDFRSASPVPQGCIARFDTWEPPIPTARHGPSDWSCSSRATGSNLQAIIDACADGRLPADVVAVVSNTSDVFALQRADAAGVPAVHVGVHPGEERADYDARLADVVAGFDPDLVVLAGWMRILTMSFLGWFPEPGRQPPPGTARRAARHPRHRAGVGRGDRRRCARRPA